MADMAASVLPKPFTAVAESAYFSEKQPAFAGTWNY